jgi:hypothetical protein
MRRREPRDFSSDRSCGLIGKGKYVRSRKLVDRSAASHTLLYPPCLACANNCSLQAAPEIKSAKCSGEQLETSLSRGYLFTSKQIEAGVDLYFPEDFPAGSNLSH